MGALDLQNIASMSYNDFQKILDPEGEISGIHWFKNSNLFYGLQDEIRSVLTEMEAISGEPDGWQNEQPEGE